MMSSWAQTGVLMFFMFAGPTLWTATGTGYGTAFPAGAGCTVHGVASMQLGLWEGTAARSNSTRELRIQEGCAGRLETVSSVLFIL